MRVLIPGIAGRLGQMLALRLREHGHTVAGLDRRPWPDAPKDIAVHAVDIRKRPAEDVFRKHRPEVVVHMATVSHFVASQDERYHINLGGTRAVFDHSLAHGVEHVVFVGRHTYYGAGPDTPLYHTEDEPPMALETFPELSDLVAADLYAQTALWRTAKFTTTVLRMCYSLGASGHGTLSTFLRGRTVPTVLGFDPLYHVLHDDDAVDALAEVVRARPRGVFNVAGTPPLPLSMLIAGVGRRRTPIPEPVFAMLLGRFGLPRLPRGAISHVKYPVVIDGGLFAETVGFRPRRDVGTAMADYVRSFPPPVREARTG